MRKIIEDKKIKIIGLIISLIIIGRGILFIINSFSQGWLNPR